MSILTGRFSPRTMFMTPDRSGGGAAGLPNAPIAVGSTGSGVTTDDGATAGTAPGVSADASAADIRAHLGTIEAMATQLQELIAQPVTTTVSPFARAGE